MAKNKEQRRWTRLAQMIPRSFQKSEEGVAGEDDEEWERPEERWRPTTAAWDAYGRGEASSVHARNGLHVGPHSMLLHEVREKKLRSWW